MAVRFILSLDCEGKWGVADGLGQREHEWLCDAKLGIAYKSILDLLDEYSVPATFAFVGLFAEPEESFSRLKPQIDALASRSPGFLGAALSDMVEGSRQGWHGAWAVEAVGSARTGHELALHGVTHVPWTSQDRNFFTEELGLWRMLSSPVRDSKTFVFPRNAVAHTELLAPAGLEGFRLGRKMSRVASLASEFNLRSRPERVVPPKAGEPVAIPAGYFVNWRHGLRRLVPAWVTRARFQALLDRAGETDVVHAWLHPENIASAPATLDLLRDIIRMIARQRDLGRCLPMTQLDFVRSVRPTAQ
ncbi:MAG: polysaccharide deacetylase family protein [Pseudomonadota bacterium]|nr:polysaccharide deacetylase family protein [Sphingomonas sp.]MDQ3479315.1 polysaccharide deacetylase family protein [Pseudomonadota bacterium]